MRPHLDNTGLPPGVQELISRYFRSVEQLEVLLLLRRQAARSWTASAVSYELRTSSVSATGRLEVLREQGFISGEPGSLGSYRYRPASVELEQAVLTMAEAYSTHRTSVVAAIIATPRANDPT